MNNIYSFYFALAAREKTSLISKTKNKPSWSEKQFLQICRPTLANADMKNDKGFMKCPCFGILWGWMGRGDSECVDERLSECNVVDHLF